MNSCRFFARPRPGSMCMCSTKNHELVMTAQPRGHRKQGSKKKKRGHGGDWSDAAVCEVIKEAGHFSLYIGLLNDELFASNAKCRLCKASCWCANLVVQTRRSFGCSFLWAAGVGKCSGCRLQKALTWKLWDRERAKQLRRRSMWTKSHPSLRK